MAIYGRPTGYGIRQAILFFPVVSSSISLWSPYGIGQTVIFWKGQEGKNSS